MLRRTMAVALALSLVLVAASVYAQCVVGVYADADGTKGTMVPGLDPNNPIQPVEKHMYVVAYAEDVMNAMSFNLTNPDPANAFEIGALFGPNGVGINVATPGGFNVGLGECAVGFGGLPILIADFTYLFTPDFIGGEFCLLPNTDQDPVTDPSLPQYSDCQGVLKSCDNGPCLLVEPPIASDSQSFGAIKALY
jgi:hypothetical protein